MAKNISLNNTNFILGFLLCTLVAGIGYWTLNKNNNQQYSNWQITGGSKENIKYSSLNEIDTNNVNSLKVAWV